MRSSIAWSLGGLLLAVGSSVHANETEPRPSILVEGHLGHDGPLGSAGLGILYDQGRFALGVGAGYEDVVGSNDDFRLALLARLRLLRWGPLALGLTASGSLDSYKLNRTYTPPQTDSQTMTWEWSNAKRLNGGLAAELVLPRWSFRLEGGLGVLFGRPACQYQDSLRSASGCDSPEIPAAYHLSPEPGRFHPYVTASVGYRFGLPGGDVAPESHRDVSGWSAGEWGKAFLWGDLIGLAGAAVGAGVFYGLAAGLRPGDGNDESQTFHGKFVVVSTLAGGALGWTLGTAAGVHGFGRRTSRGGGSFTTTLAGGFVGALATAAAAWTAYELARSGRNPEYRAYVTAGILGPVLPALGAGFGYLLSAPAAAPTPGLVHYSPETGVGLGLPMVSVVNATGTSTVNVALAAGSF